MNFKYYKTTYLITVVILLAGLLDWSIGTFLIPLLKNNHLEYLIRIPSNAAIIGGLLILYDQFLWKCPIFSFLVSVPDMNGRYTGNIHYRWKNEAQSKDCVVEINQTASKIHVRSFFNNENRQRTESRSFIETIEKGDDGNYSIYLFYSNGGSKTDGKLDTHEGANMLKYLPKTTKTRSKLTGYYFTNRQKQTKGEIEVVFESKKRKGEF
ncbi:MAG: hypothetical protein WCK92_07880 [Bacteroidota bacterium]